VKRLDLRSIRSKLLLVFLAGTLVPLGSGLMIAAAQDLRRFKHDLVDRVTAVASVVEEYSAADLAFEDPAASHRTLAKVARLEEVIHAALYSSSGQLFATYERQGTHRGELPQRIDPAAPRRVEVLDDSVRVYEGVAYRGQRYGTLYLEASTERLRERVHAYRRGLVIVAICLLALYWVLALLLRRILLRPLTELTQVARKLERTGDYSLRARKAHEDELGVLAETFNSMVAEVERRQHEAHEALKARDDFLSVASHELKTPLTTLKLHTQQLQAVVGANPDVLPSRQRLLKVCGASIRQVRRLEKLVDQLLDVTRIAAGRLQLEVEEVDLSKLVTDLTDRFREELQQARCSLEVSAPIAVIGQWDPFRLDQVVSNLLSNAIKYGAGSPIEVEVTSDECVVRVSVTDHGIGVAKEEQERIFAPFERVVSVRHYGGLGLGLYITRQIVEAHHGRIRVESNEKEGSTFTVELPRSS
jgi:signal transduction histidine kinase